MTDSLNTSVSIKDTAGWQACGAAYVAVYGTLRAGGINDIARLQPGLACCGTTLLRGRLHDLGWYPGLTLDGQQPVLAAVLIVSGLVLMKLSSPQA